MEANHVDYTELLLGHMHTEPELYQPYIDMWESSGRMGSSELGAIGAEHICENERKHGRYISLIRFRYIVKGAALSPKYTHGVKRFDINVALRAEIENIERAKNGGLIDPLDFIIPSFQTGETADFFGKPVTIKKMYATTYFPSHVAYAVEEYDILIRNIDLFPWGYKFKANDSYIPRASA